MRVCVNCELCFLLSAASAVPEAAKNVAKKTEKKVKKLTAQAEADVSCLRFTLFYTLPSHFSIIVINFGC